MKLLLSIINPSSSWKHVKVVPAEIPDEAVKLMKDYNPDASVASWAYRFVGSRPGVRVVLAGMPKMEFLDDNMETFNNFKPLNEEEYKILDQVVEIINSNTPIACTYCRYCEVNADADRHSRYLPFIMIVRLQKDSTINPVRTQAFYYASMIERGRGHASSCINVKSVRRFVLSICLSPNIWKNILSLSLSVTTQGMT